MKKILAVIMTLAMLISFCGLTTVAGADESASVYVSISDDKGELVLTQAEVTVTDTDEDGVLTVKDALYQSHEDYYEGGAAEGFASSVGSYGIQLDKLWGVANGGSYGYYVNDVSAMGLGDAVKDGDYINAYVYTDLAAWSDTYSFFDVKNVETAAGTDVELTLSAAGYDAEWNPVTLPVEGATITVNGEATEYKTDAEGKVTIQLSEAGLSVISAVSDAQVLVPPVCLATVSSNDTANVYVTISNDKGELVLVQEEVAVSDIDKDGELTINDALYIAHEENYEGGAAAGYASAYTAYGLSLNKLWGIENGGSYGYYVDNGSAWSLADIVSEGSYINAFVYTDLASWSDTYCFFDYYLIETTEGEAIELVLNYAGYDAEWNPVALPVEGATITVNGEATEYKTDAEGKVVLSLEAGDYVISAVSETMTLVPPVCEVSVTEVVDNTPDNNTNAGNDNANNNAGHNNVNNNNGNTNNSTVKPSGTTTAPKTADNSMVVLYVALMFAAVSVIFVLNNKKVYEK